MARKASAPQHVEPENESQEAPDDEGGTPVTRMKSGRAVKVGGESITKAEAIRKALAEGLTKYEDAAPFVKTHFGHEITPGHFSASKSREKVAEPGQPAPRRGRPPGKANAVTVKVKRGRKPKAALEAQSAPAQKPQPANGSVVGDLAAIKALVEKLGVAEVKQIAELFG